mgnify:CR=1 FL=1
MNSVNIKKSLMLMSCLTLTSCSMLDTHQLDDNANHVNIYDDFEQVKHCQYLGELVGSEGKWYTFFFISNTDLTLGSIADLKNKAVDIGANSIHIEEHMGFNTSVTFLGHAYECPQS